MPHWRVFHRWYRQIAYIVSVPKRVILFVDYQNVYRCARDAYEATGAPSSFGQVLPLRIGQLICSEKFRGAGEGRVLAGVRVYCGRPSQAHDAKGYAAHRRQSAAWEKLGITVVTRTLRYLGGVVQEKGIDVSLAIDFVSMAVDKKFDVGVIFSTDTDLIPALEFVVDRPEMGVVAEVAAWAEHQNSPLGVSGSRIRCHRLTKLEYRAVSDPKVYLSD